MPELWSMCAVKFRTEVGIMRGIESRANTSPELLSHIRICIRGNMNPCLWGGLHISGQLQLLTTILVNVKKRPNFGFTLGDDLKGKLIQTSTLMIEKTYQRCE